MTYTIISVEIKNCCSSLDSNPCQIEFRVRRVIIEQRAPPGILMRRIYVAFIAHSIALSLHMYTINISLQLIEICPPWVYHQKCQNISLNNAKKRNKISNKVLHHSLWNQVGRQTPSALQRSPRLNYFLRIIYV